MTVVLANGGPLLDSMSVNANVSVAGQLWGRDIGELSQAVATRAAGPSGRKRVREVMARRAVQAAGPADVVYLNGITEPGAELLAAVDPAIPVVTHIHELGIGFDHTTSREGLELIHARTDRFLAVSDAAADLAAERFSLSGSSIARAAALLPDPLPKPSAEARQAARYRLHISDDRFVVGACGLRDWRKAPELFLRLAWEVQRAQCRLPIEFRWIGGEGANDWQLHHEARSLGVAERVSFVSEVADASELLVGLDALAITAREDAYPLAALEAAAAGVPLLAFDAGGIVEFIGSDAGRVFAPGDTAAMAETVIELAANPTLQAGFSKAAREKVVARHEPARSREKLWSLITGVVSS